jgi:subtilisin family serine protease
MCQRIHWICRWGPPDDGQTIEGPRILTQTALEQGVKLGRFGLGSIYVIASGNGGANDYCTFDGYASSIYTIAVGAVDSTGKLPAYGEMCPSQLISAYSGGSGFERVVSFHLLNYLLQIS